MEQHPQARQDALNRVRSAFTQLVNWFVVRNLNKHAGLQRKTSGQLPNPGSTFIQAKYAASRRIHCASSDVFDSYLLAGNWKSGRQKLSSPNHLHLQPTVQRFAWIHKISSYSGLSEAFFLDW
jgi:hypothetical protein